MGRGQVFPAAKARSLLNPLRRLVQSPGKTVAAMRLSADAHVLELGPGPGFFSPHIVGSVPRGRVVLADLQDEMLSLARDRVGTTNVGFVQSDAMALPFASATFDAVFVATMLGEVPDPARCLAELRRVLRPTGIAAFAETRRDSDFFSLTQLKGLVEPHGLAFVERRGTRWQYVARFRAC